MLFWLCAVMFSVATSCTIASRPTVTCSASDGKADSSETHTEVVESNKRFVISVVFLELAQFVHVSHAGFSRLCMLCLQLRRLSCFVRINAE